MDDVIIRSARLEELATLLEFEQGIIKAERPFDPTLAPDPICYYDLEGLIKSDHAEVIVAEVDSEIVGSGFARIDGSKPYLKFEKHSYLGFMYVDPRFRGKGINQKVTQALLDWSQAKGMTEVRLEVYAENQPAVRAYEKAGFTKNLVEMRISIPR